MENVFTNNSKFFEVRSKILLFDPIWNISWLNISICGSIIDSDDNLQ